MKKWIVIIAVVAFILGTVHAGMTTYEFYGIISSIKGKTITVKSNAGQTKTIKAGGAWHVGDKVRIRGNKVEAWGGEVPAPDIKQAPGTNTTPKR